VGRSRNVYTSLAILTCLIPFKSKRVLLWRFYVAGNNKTHLKYPLKLAEILAPL